MSRIVPLILSVALFMEMMDATVIATSLPAIAMDIGTDPVALKLALTSYLVALAIFIPVSGWLSDRYGAVNVFRIAIGVFMLGSLACAFSNSLETFVISRFLQGMGGSMMMPVGRVLLLRATPKSDLVSAMAWLTIPALIGPLAGPPLGGFITTYFSWHWIFIINIPIGIVGIFLAGKYLPRSGKRIKTSLDLTGFLLVAITLSGIVFGLSVISLPALPPAVGATTLALGLLAGFAYWRHTLIVDKPILDPKIFRDKNFTITTVWGALFRLSIGAFPFLVPLMLQVGYGLNPFQSGLITFSGAGGALAMKFFAKQAYARFGFYKVLPVAILINSAFMLTYGFVSPVSFAYVLIGFIFLGGLTRSLLFTGANALMYATLPEEDTAQGSAIAAVSAQVSIAIGVAIAGSLLEISGFLRGGELALVDFQTALVVLALIAALAAIPFARLRANAGSNVSGYKD
ncbi:MAG: MFS transporter [Devosiaceae bacterium]|nr:MFS transporter [Devosiaceae bacterium]